MFCIIFKSDFYSFKPYIRPISYFLVEVSYIFLFSLIESFETPFWHFWHFFYEISKKLALLKRDHELIIN